MYIFHFKQLVAVRKSTTCFRHLKLTSLQQYVNILEDRHAHLTLDNKLPLDVQLQWLRSAAEDIMENTIKVKDVPYPNEEDVDEVYMYHRALLHVGFLYVHLREAIRLENAWA